MSHSYVRAHLEEFVELPGDHSGPVAGRARSHLVSSESSNITISNTSDESFGSSSKFSYSSKLESDISTSRSFYLEESDLSTSRSFCLDTSISSSYPSYRYSSPEAEIDTSLTSPRASPRRVSGSDSTTPASPSPSTSPAPLARSPSPTAPPPVGGPMLYPLQRGDYMIRINLGRLTHERPGLLCVCESAKPEKHAILVAATKGWTYYRHQATVFHAYHSLLKNGFKKDNIITMFYDDIADNFRNKEKPIVRNHPEGPDVYKDVKKDYTGDKVTAKTFLAILDGNTTIAGGPVLKSAAKDNVFIYIAGLGSEQYIYFPTGVGLVAKDFINALDNLKKNKRARKVLVYLDSTFGGTIFDGIVARRGHVFALTATHYNEIPYAVYCNRYKKICYGSLFGTAFVERMNRLRKLKYGHKENLYDNFNVIRTLTVYTHVNIYGHLETGKGYVKDFFNHKLEGPNKFLAKSMVDMLRNDIDLADDSELSPEMEILKQNEIRNDIEKISGEIEAGGEIMSDSEVFEAFELEDDEPEDALASVATIAHANTRTKRSLELNRNMIQDTMKNIYQYLNKNGYPTVAYDSSNILPPLDSATSHKYVQAIETFSTECINVNENPYALRELSKLGNLCLNGISMDKISNAMQAVCGPHHRMIRNVH